MDIGDQLPHVKVGATNGLTLDFQTLLGKNVVLYFYPKDCTPGCTLEGKDFRDHFLSFQEKNTIILGISRDTIASHEKFKKQHDFSFELIADEDGTLCRLFDVLRPKNMFGKIVNGIQRSTFLFDSHGKLKKVWRKVKVEGHVEEVLQALDA